MAGGLNQGLLVLRLGSALCALTSGPGGRRPGLSPRDRLAEGRVGTASVGAGPPGPRCSQPGARCCPFWGRGLRRPAHRLAAHGGAVNQPGPATARRHLLRFGPRSPGSSGGDRGENSPILRGVCCLVGRQETRGNWLKKPQRLGRLQASPGQWGCQAGSGGGEPGAGLRPMGGIQRGVQARPAPCGAALGSLPSPEEPQGLPGPGGPAGAARGPHHGPGDCGVGVGRRAWAPGGLDSSA